MPNTFFRFRKQGKLSVATSMAVLIVGFVLVLAGLNFYQYWKLKNHFATEELGRIKQGEVDKLKSILDSISTKLFIIHDLGANGIFSFSDVVALNRQLMPLLENQDIVAGIVVADNTGREYYLRLEDGKWISRLSWSTENGSHMVFQEWSSPEKCVRKWEENSEYNPLKRPWFYRLGSERQIFWSPVYNFFSTGKLGVTASIACSKPDSPGEYFVFAVDVPLERLQKLLGNWNNRGNVGKLFLINPDSGFYISSDHLGRFGKNPSEHFLDKPASSEESLIFNIIERWNKQGRPVNQFVEVLFHGQKWMASLMSIRAKNGIYWLGIAAPSDALYANLRSTFFDVNFSDVVVALTVDVLLFMIFLALSTSLMGHSKWENLPSDERMRYYIKLGEGSGVEFKSTVRTNLKTGKQGKEIEFAWLKAVVAFLNSNGGALLLGVNDDGDITGIEPDNFESRDKCQLHLKNLINHHIGAEFSSFINIVPVDVEGKTVVMLECYPSREPVFMRIGKNEEFYIRSGPSSMKLSPSKMIIYVLQKMKMR